MSPELEKRLEELKSEKMSTIVMPKSIADGLIELLERDTKLKPRRVVAKLVSGYCSRCELTALQGYELFCPLCGQRIDWSE